MTNAPFSSHLDAHAELADRFWYWRGASGRQYIHSVYTPRTCPPLPSGVFIAVRRLNDVRHAVAVGLFRDIFDSGSMQLAAPDTRAADELHVHLLARNPADAEAVLRDLAAAVQADLASTVLPPLKARAA